MLPLSTAHTSRLEVLAECGSTNTVMVGHAADSWPDFSAVVTDNQTGGRGRLGRQWVAPPGRALAVSVLLRPSFGADALGWVPLIAGVAMAHAVREVLPGIRTPSSEPVSSAELPHDVAPGAPEERLGATQAADDAGSTPTRGEPLASATHEGRFVTPRVGLKWPNDVLIAEKKVSGILAELVSTSPAAIVLGAGLNLSFDEEQLPTPTSTSLTLHGADVDGLLDRALAAYLRELRALYELLATDAAQVRALVTAECVTLGRSVRLHLPSGEIVTALATGIDVDGRLLVTTSDGAEQAVGAGDVTHLRYE